MSETAIVLILIMVSLALWANNNAKAEAAQKLHEAEVARLEKEKQDRDFEEFLDAIRRGKKKQAKRALRARGLDPSLLNITPKEARRIQNNPTRTRGDFD